MDQFYKHASIQPKNIHCLTFLNSNLFQKFVSITSTLVLIKSQSLEWIGIPLVGPLVCRIGKVKVVIVTAFAGEWYIVDRSEGSFAFVCDLLGADGCPVFRKNKMINKSMSISWNRTNKINSTALSCDQASERRCIALRQVPTTCILTLQRDHAF